MTKLKETAKLLLTHLLSYIPRPLPVGMSQHEKFVSRIACLCKDTTTNLSDIIFTTSAMIMRLDPTTNWKSDRYFVKSIKAVASKQIVGARLAQIKEEQQKQQEALKNQQAADTAQQSVSADGQKS